MAWVTRHVVAITTAADGTATAYTPVVNGFVQAIRYVKTDFADGSTMTITADVSGMAIWSETGVNASATRMPQGATHSTAGAAALYAAAGTAVNAPIAVADERIKIVIAGGGNAKSGTFHIYVGG